MSVRPIILAEDNEKLRRMYGDMLESSGYTVMRAADGEKAIGLLHKIGNPMMIILDVMMPRLDGIETCIRIRKMQGLRPCPILFLTALDNPETMLECLRAGGDDFLMKSVPMGEVLERVQYWGQKVNSDENAARRQKAIKELEEMLAEEDGSGQAETEADSADDRTAINQLADFINAGGSISEDDPLLYRFGYVVGLVNACFTNQSQSSGKFSRFLRNLIYRTSCIDRNEIDALLDNYERIITQQQFQSGWALGRNDAAKARKAGSFGTELLGEAHMAE